MWIAADNHITLSHGMSSGTCNVLCVVYCVLCIVFLELTFRDMPIPSPSPLPHGTARHGRMETQH
jgi:hypothetical protein